MKKCEVENCDRDVLAMNLCGMHYQRKRHNKDMHVELTNRGDCLRFLNDAINFNEEICLEWPFAITTHGYPVLTINGKRVAGHRYICEKTHGKPDWERSDVAHSCKNPKCINPNHLRWATKRENMADKLIHGTDNRGAKNPSAKLTEEDVREILKNDNLDDLAKKYSIKKQSIRNIKNGMRWKHIPRD